MENEIYLNEEQWNAAVKASLISPEIALGFDPRQSLDEAYRNMPDAELEREAISSGFYTKQQDDVKTDDVKKFVRKVLGSFGTNNAPGFLEFSGVGLEDVVRDLGIKHLRELENIGYTPNVWRGLGYEVRFVDGGKIDRIYRKLEDKCVQCYP